MGEDIMFTGGGGTGSPSGGTTLNCGGFSEDTGGFGIKLICEGGWRVKGGGGR